MIRQLANVRITNADDATLMSVQDIDQGFPPAKATHDLLVEVGVCEESRPHAVGAGVLLRASSSFA